MAPICFGTQTTGSVIRPAYCGVLAQATYGDFDKSGILPNSPSIDTLGLMSDLLRTSPSSGLFYLKKLVEKKNCLSKIRIGFVKTPHGQNWSSTQNKLKR